ncbi:potassium channel family protein [Paraburkholderia acidipaludis]|uniref:potassium channel family protein n=1 Tax=Paraburkholderia acidipaludis TaxID=660537 RepID=UPI000482B84D|nr:potassium channel family protein [Paraburkholderia acidipaludis]
MNTGSGDDLHIKISPRIAVAEIGRVLWHLRSFLIILLLIFGALSTAMYYVGGAVNTITRTQAPPGETLYFCAVTALTIGYGDIVPTTAAGRIIAVLLGMLGVLTTGVIAGSTVYGIQVAAQRAGLLSR